MKKVLTGLHWQICLVYLDNAIVYSKDMATYLVQLNEVFKKLRKAGLTLKPKKCHLLKTQILYLGHRVSGEGIATDPDKIKAIKEWRPPRDLPDFRSFLGL